MAAALESGTLVPSKVGGGNLKELAYAQGTARRTSSRWGRIEGVVWRVAAVLVQHDVRQRHAAPQQRTTYPG